jgi:hypothetical protein
MACSFVDQMNYIIIGVTIGILAVTFWYVVAWGLSRHK